MKKLLSVLVALSIFTASLTGLAFAVSAEDTASLTKAEDGYYYISTAAEFNLISATEAALAAASEAPGSYRITADITEEITTPVSSEFIGSVTGWDLTASEPTVRNIALNLTNNDATDYGLFNLLGTGAYIGYLSISGTVSFSGNITQAGGFAGRIPSGKTGVVLEYLTNNLSEMNTTGVTYLGGIVGYNYGSAAVRGCVNNANLTSTRSSSQVGGIAGMSTGTFEACLNTGDVTGKAYAGGIIAWVGGSCEVSKSANYGSITADNYASGLIALVRSNASVTDCFNAGALTASNTVSAIALADRRTTDSNSMNITRYYDANGYSYTPLRETLSDVTAAAVFNFSEAYTTANSSDITVLSEKDTLMANSWDFDTVWTYDEANAGYSYPQLQSVPLINATLSKDSEGYYLIEKASDFALISAEADGSWGKYRLANDITEAVTEPVTLFGGEFDGNGKAVNIAFSGNYDAIGLFITLSGANVYDLTITGSLENTSEAQGATNGSGALAGVATGGTTITNVTNKANVTKNPSKGSYGAGIAGVLNGNSQIINCKNEGEIESRYYAGGIVGYLTSATVSGSSNTSKVTAYTQPGGIVGLADANAVIEKCYNTGEIYASGYSAGGIAGYSASSSAAAASISNCYNSGKISILQTGNGDCGGILGGVKDGRTADITNCYNSGELTEFFPISVSAAVMSGCYYLSEEKTDDSIDNTEPLSSSEMKNQEAFAETFVGWDSSVWSYDSANPSYVYPQLTGNYQAVPEIEYGTEEFPWEIRTADDFTEIAGKCSSEATVYFRVMNDIDLTGAAYESLDVSNINITGWDEAANKPVIRKIAADYSNALFKSVSGASYIGYLETVSENGYSISDSTADAGGIVSTASGTLTVSNCINNISISGTAKDMGGIIANGYNGIQSVTVTDCINNGSLTNSTSRTAGIISIVLKGTVSGCVNNGSINGSSYAAGIIACLYGGEITASYNNGAISGGSVAGMISNSRYGFNITDSYNNGLLTGSKAESSICSYVDYRVDNTYEINVTNYYDAKANSVEPVLITSGSTTANPVVTFKNVYTTSDADTDAVLKDKTQLIADGWDFDTVWSYDEANIEYLYPQLTGRYQSVEPGTASDPLEIATAEELYALKDIDTTGIHYELTAEVYDLTAVDGYTPFEFKGILHGNNKTVIPSDKGIFSALTGAKVTDLIIGTADTEQTIVSDTEYFGALAYTLTGGCELENVVNYVNVSSSARRFAGLAGSAANTEFIGCINYGDVCGSTVSSTTLGGIVALTNNAVIIDSCKNYGQISTLINNAGGIVGWHGGGTADIKNSVNYGNVTCESASAAGIVGSNTAILNVTDCINLGNITMLGETYSGGSAGGILGSNRIDGTRQAVIKGCYNAGIVSVAKEENELADYKRFNPIAPISYTEDANSFINISDSYYVAYDINSDSDGYDGTTALTASDFIAKNALFENLEFVKVSVSGDAEKGYLSPYAPSGSVLAIKGSDVTLAAAPKMGYDINAESITLNGSVVSLTEDSFEDELYYTYVTESISSDSVFTVEYTETVALSAVLVPDIDVKYDDLLPVLGMADYLKVTGKPGILVFAKIADPGNKASEYGICINGIFIKAGSKNADGSFGAYVYGALDTDGTYNVKAYAKTSESDDIIYGADIELAPQITK